MWSEPVTFGGGMAMEKTGAFSIAVDLGSKTTLRFPSLVVILFGLFRIVLFRNFHNQWAAADQSAVFIVSSSSNFGFAL